MAVTIISVIVAKGHGPGKVIASIASGFSGDVEWGG